jgi:hypothetical protein
VVRLTVSSPDELIAAVPHLMGFHVESSIVVIPISPGLPHARVDLPSNQAERTAMVDSLMRAYGRGGPGEVMVIGFANGPEEVEQTSGQLREALAGADALVRGRLWAGEHHWGDLDTGVGGNLTREAANRIGAEMAHLGERPPAPSRSALDQEFVGDPEPITRQLPGIADDMAHSTPAVERQWAISRAEAFLVDGRRLDDPEAARMIACLQSTTVRDHMIGRVTQDTALAWGPLWDDLTRRSPVELVAPPAALSALSNWCQGNGARAWMALDRIPSDQRRPNELANLIASALENGVHPREWDRARSSVLGRRPPGEAAGVGVRSERGEPPTIGTTRGPSGPSR